MIVIVRVLKSSLKTYWYADEIDSFFYARKGKGGWRLDNFGLIEFQDAKIATKKDVLEFQIRKEIGLPPYNKTRKRKEPKGFWDVPAKFRVQF